MCDGEDDNIGTFFALPEISLLPFFPEEEILAGADPDLLNGDKVLQQRNRTDASARRKPIVRDDVDE